MSRLKLYYNTIFGYADDAFKQMKEAEEAQIKFDINQKDLINNCKEYIDGVDDCLKAFVNCFPELFTEDELLGYENSTKEKRKILEKTALNLKNVEDKLDEMIEASNVLAKKSAEVGNEASEQFASGGASALRMFKIVLRGFEE